MDYILVYNSKYNEKLGGQFLGKMKIVTEKLGLEKFEKYFFNKVYTYSKEEFEEKFVNKDGKLRILFRKIVKRNKNVNL